MLRERLDRVGPVDQVFGAAALLVAAAHETRDRSVWGGDRALSYWDRLPEKIRAACYAGPTLAHWWDRICMLLGSGQPGRAEDRAALGDVLHGGEDAAVLDVLRTRPEAVALHVRLAVQLDRERKESADE